MITIHPSSFHFICSTVQYALVILQSPARAAISGMQGTGTAQYQRG
jgi:hypothetical protein